MELLIKPLLKNEVRVVVWFLFVKKVLIMEIRYLVAIYSENLISVHRFANSVNSSKLDGNSSKINHVLCDPYAPQRNTFAE